MAKHKAPWWYWFGDHAPILFWFAMGTAIGATVAVYMGAMNMKSELANILGGVLGAGLGAAGGVLGGLVVYGKQRRDNLIGPLNELAGQWQEIIAKLGTVKTLLETAGKHKRREMFRSTLANLYAKLAGDTASLQLGAELPSSLHEAIVGQKRSLESLMLMLPIALESFLDDPQDGDESSDGGLSGVSDQVAACEALLHSLRAL